MIGLRILARKRKVADELVEAFRSLPVANISDVMNRLHSGGAALKPLHDGSPLCGPALTVRTPPGDNLFVHKALDIAEPGDVIVVDAGGDLTNAIIGEMMVAHAIRQHIGGIVIHGAIRDYDAIRAGSFPVFAAGVTHRGPYKNGPGEINTPIALHGMVIEPGDLIVGDGDGIVCISYQFVSEVLTLAVEKQQHETAHIEALRSGTSDRGWIDRQLESLGCFVESGQWTKMAD